jgi:hypothetical protein
LRLALFGTLLASLAASQSQPLITVDKVMTGEELRTTGVGTLTASQRATLDRWLSEYTLKVFQYAQGSEKPASAGTASSNYTGSGGGHWIKSKSGNGSMIVLEDGSMWEINSLDRIDTALWLPISNITILKASQPVGDYNYTLVNKDDGEKALAKFLGKE